MKVSKTKAIVLSMLKFQEKNAIVTCYTADFGLQTYFATGVFSSQKNNPKRAYFQPLRILEVVTNTSKKGAFNYFKEIKVAQPFFSIQQNISKTTMAIFLADFLKSCIKEEEANPALFNFIETSILWLDVQPSHPNFHLIFCMEIAKYLGFYPEVSTSNAAFFDIKEGRFSDIQTPTCLQESASFLFKKLVQLHYNDTTKLFNSTERQLLLEIVFQYYQYHLDGFRKPMSATILHEVFL